MKLVEVVPLTTVKTIARLTYFSNLPLNLGDLVTVEINKRKVFGVVSLLEDAADRKQEIRNVEFSLKKVDSVTIPNLIDEQIVLAMRDAASFAGTNLSTFLSLYLPIDFLKNEKLNFKIDQSRYKLHGIELTRYDSIGNIKQIIREKFARDESVIIICPTIVSAENLKSNLESGIEDSTIVYHSDISKKEKDRTFKQIFSNKKVCLISTPNIVGLFCHNPYTIIIHEEESKYYDHVLERVNARNIFYFLAKSLGIETILTSRTPSLEHYYLSLTEMRSPLLVQNYAKEKILFSKMNDRDHKPYSMYFSYELKLMMDECVKENKKVVLYSQRKGISSSSVCADCGESVKCETCDKDLCLFTSDNTRYYRCLECKTKIKLDREIVCKVCDGMRINTLGVGTEGLVLDLATLYPDTNIYIMDGDHVKSKREALKLYEKFSESGGVLVGTEMMLPIIRDIDLIGLISIDTYFSLPEYNTDEEALGTTLLLANSLSQNGRIVIQSRRKSHIWDFAQSASLKKYYESELDNRNETKLPPFSYVISFDLPDNINPPEFIHDHTSEYYNIKSRNFTRHIFFIPRKTWQEDPSLRLNIVNLLITYNLEVNGRSILKGL